MKTYELSKEEQDALVLKRSLERGKYTHLTEDITQQYLSYRPLTKEEWKERHRGMLVKFPKEQVNKGAMRRIFEAFLKTERIDYFKAHSFTVEDIVRIGIDKFVVANGWTQPRDVKTWRNNIVRIGVCPHCKDQFATLIYEANHGLCRNCVPEYSSEAIQGFLIREAQTDAYLEHHASLAVNFYMLFANDKPFRELFLKGTPTAVEFEGEIAKYEEKVQAELQQAQQPCDEKSDNDNVIDISEDGEVIN